MVCNGHYSAVNNPEVPGAVSFPGLLMHSHNYRGPEPFAGQTVVVVGASNSGDDLCREVAGMAGRVYLSARSWKDPALRSNTAPFGLRRNIYRYGGSVC